VLEFKNLVKPRHNKALSLPYLAAPNFKGCVQKMLRNHIKDNLDRIPSFHIPTAKTVEARHKSVESILFNHFKFFRQWEEAPPTTCSCAKFIRENPNVSTTDGHVATPADQMSLPSGFLKVAQYAANSKYYEAKETYIKVIVPKIDVWAKWHNLPPIDPQTVQDTINTVWPDHLQASKDTISAKQVFVLKQKTRGMVAHCQDHQPHRVCVFCPILFHNTLKSTFFRSRGV